MNLPQIGDVFEARYELLAILGQGGFATVYRAADRSVARDVVIKVLSPRDGGYPKPIVARFMREARVFAELHDPHTITMYDFGQSDDGLLYMVFEYVRGRDLADVLREEGSLHPAVVVHIVSQVASALREAHGLGVLHRDIKPANVLAYTYDGDAYRVKLLDFGIAKDVTPEAAQITRTGAIIGTPRYMAPEQLVAQPPGPDSDIYSLGLVATELLTGSATIAGDTQRDILRAQLAETPLLVPPECAPVEVRRVLERMMARERGARHQSAGELLGELRSVRTVAQTWRGVPEDVGPVREPADSLVREPVAAPAQPSPRGPRDWRLVALGVLAMLAFAGVLGSVFLPSEPPDPPPRVVALPMAEPVPEPAAEAVHDASADHGHVDMSPGGDGCGRRPPFQGSGAMDEIASGLWVYVPKGYDPQKRYPIVMMFHRSLRDGAEMLSDTGMGDVADEAGFVIFSFSSREPTQWPLEDDQVVRDALALGATRLCIDPTRLFAIGDVGGATMVRHLACVMPLSAYVAVFDGSAKTCKPVVPTARMRIYGRRDKTVPVEGGFGCNVFAGKRPSAEHVDRSWKLRHQCVGGPKPWGDFAGGECRTWDCELAPLVTCETDAGHQWPRSPGAKLDIGGVCYVEPPAVDFPYGEAIWQFFDQHGHVIDP